MLIKNAMLEERKDPDTRLARQSWVTHYLRLLDSSTSTTIPTQAMPSQQSKSAARATQQARQPMQSQDAH
eukprot:10384113-Prorocentrum_lima.AAC.1